MLFKTSKQIRQSTSKKWVYWRQQPSYWEKIEVILFITIFLNQITKTIELLFITLLKGKYSNVAQKKIANQPGTCSTAPNSWSNCKKGVGWKIQDIAASQASPAVITWFQNNSNLCHWNRLNSYNYFNLIWHSSNVTSSRKVLLWSSQNKCLSHTCKFKFNLLFSISWFSIIVYNDFSSSAQ